MTALADAVRYRWDAITPDTPVDLVQRRRIDGERFMVCEITLLRGAIVNAHRHENEQMAMVMSGRLRFVVGEGERQRDVIVAAGEVLHLPSNILHSVETLEDTTVLDLFSPPTDSIGLDQQRDAAP